MFNSTLDRLAIAVGALVGLVLAVVCYQFIPWYHWYIDASFNFVSHHPIQYILGMLVVAVFVFIGYADEY